MRRGLKPAAWGLGLGLVAWLVVGTVQGTLGAEPVREGQHLTGLAALGFLFGSLALTPLRHLTGVGALVQARRLLGLWAFAFAVLHVLSYAVFDQSLDPRLIAEDVREHPWVLAGAAAFLCLVPLAATSTAGMIRRLGGARWRALHRLAYAAAIAGAIHFLWLVKKDVRAPWLWLAGLGLLFAARLPVVTAALDRRRGV